MKVNYFLRDDGACGYYRVDLPLTVLSKKYGVKAVRTEPGEPDEVIRAKAMASDVVVLPRLAEAPIMDFAKTLMDAGKKIVVDHDDDMFNISPLNPHYQDFGTKEYSHAMNDGTTLDVWKDGKNIDIDTNKKKMEAIKDSLKQTNLLTVTTENLANCYSDYAKNISVLPNCIDINLWKKLPFKETEEIRMVWFGGYSHYEDWQEIAPALPIVMNKYKNLKLVIMGHKFDGTLRGIPEDRIEYHPWVKTPAYPYKASILNPDFAIIPLKDTPFNRCKSSIKWVEMGAMGVPSVASYVSPYKEMKDGDNGVFIENNNIDGWVTGISLMVEDRILRAKIGKAAQDYVYENYDINKKSNLWLEAYKELLD